MARPRTVLLVEDNDDDAELARAAFGRCEIPIDLVVAEDGVEALDYLFRRGAHAARTPGAPDLVLLDLKLPGIDGFEVLRQIRDDEATFGVVVVVFSSSAEETDIERSVRFGANSYVRKPIDFDQFLGVADKLASYWLVLNQRPLPGVLA